MTTLTIMRVLPREVDPMVYNMLNEDPGKISFSDIGGLNDEIRQLREVSFILRGGNRIYFYSIKTE
jgi:ATP-dependent 26S proteasome regulatory subunit